MLIPSERHAKEDLELWAEYEEADRKYWFVGRVARKVDAAIEAIRQFAEQRPCYCSVSMGKDSVAVAHLVRLAGLQMPDVPMVWVRWPACDNPDSALVALEMGDVTDVIAPENDNDDGKIGFGIANKFGARISGIRADESPTRRLSAFVHGVSTEGSCRPLLHWSIRDVFALHAYAGLPTHPAYAMLGNGRWPRDRIRVDSIGGIRGSASGRAEWEQEYYGDVLRRLAAQ